MWQVMGFLKYNPDLKQMLSNGLKASLLNYLNSISKLVKIKKASLVKKCSRIHEKNICKFSSLISLLKKVGNSSKN